MVNVFVRISKDINDHQSKLNGDETVFESISSSTSEEDALALRRKKTLLERVMKRLRELIVASQPKGMKNTYLLISYYWLL